MAFRAARLILGILLVVVAVLVAVKAVGMLVAGGKTAQDWMPPVGMVAAVLAGLGAYYYAFFVAPSGFRGFRVVLGAFIAVVAFYLIGDGVTGVIAASNKPVFQAADLTFPVAKFVVAAVLLGAFYFAAVAATGVRRTVENIFSIPELLKKLAFTLALLCIYRVGFHIPLPGLNQEVIAGFMTEQERGPFGQALAYLALFTGGNLRQSTLFGLGIMPYISAAIIFQLLVTVVPALERLQKEGQAGYKKIQEYTRYATVGLCLIQATFWMRFMNGH
jgi:hypothetical protein